MTSLTISIIGGGIAGLATALAISKEQPKHKISIYESAPQLSELGAGIQLSSNATRILYNLGIGNEFRKVANQPKIMSMHRYADDTLIGEIAQNPMSQIEYGYPAWTVFRPDIQKLLAEAVRKEEGVELVLGKRVKSVDPNEGRIFFENGEEVVSDLIIGADGLRGKVRECIPENFGFKARAFSEHCFRAVVPKEKMEMFPETKELMELDSLNMVWCGPGLCMLGYPVASGELYNLVLSVPRPPDEDAVGKWSQPGDVKEGEKLLEIFCPRARRLWSLVEECNKWTLGDLPALPTFVSESGRLVLVGDCAHAILPHSGQGGAQALEDAAALAVFVGSVKEKSELQSKMRQWSDLRQARMNGVRRFAMGNQKFLTMADGPDQQKRDQMWAAMTAGWKKALEENGEEGIRAKARATKLDPQSEDMRSPETRMYLYGYDAAEEARKIVAAAA
ncbi:FAD-dependent monooxygenase OpS4 [Pseudocercospora fuligena]|uniref:FAD-dependent monooxygenase OpS4 n=1 Tax=Pseudocercospora fuligena TaxID=685502 RepID=A0A8H6RV93_9PEZI|nr:FAD-dependent monooxygenase OpS4 [Pseudocercospora fuligena]